MKFIDTHCDSLMIALMRGGENPDLYDASCVSVDFKRMKEGGQMAQFFAIFLPPQEAYKMMGVPEIPEEDYIAACRGILMANLEKHSDKISLARNAAELRANEDAGKLSAVLSMEDGRAVWGKLKNLKQFYDMGVRALSLTWNAKNCFGSPNSREPGIMNEGLTDFGKEAVEYMQELGMLVDVSHLSDGGFKDVADICKKPFIATHSNCRALCPHPRNLTDDMLRTLGNAGGVTGINFGPEFLNEDIECKDSTAALMAKHARHMADTGGIDCVGIGSDFDGIQGNLEISDCSKVYLLEDALKKEGFSGGEIEKIFWKNTFRVIEDAMK
ncbi:MAG: dipeptidase [Lachnospiraceae bacterium]